MGKITFGKLNEIKLKLYDMDIFRLTYPIIFKELVGQLLHVNLFRLKFNDIIIECNKVDLLKIDFKYNNEDEFYELFCKSKFGIMDQPRDAYFIIRNKVIDKINEIEQRLSGLYNLKSNLKNFIPDIKDIENYKKNYSLVLFYINKNKKAMIDLKDFLVSNIENVAIRMGINGIINTQLNNTIFFRQLFPHENEWLDLDAKSILAHRYGELDYPTAEEIFKLYDAYLNNESNEYVKVPEYFLESYNKYQYIDQLCNSHHLLNKRKLLINKCINLYKTKEYLLAIQLIPTVIEGIINDICLMFDISKKALYQYGLTQKIIFIQSKHKPYDTHTYIHSLDYFRNFFPAIRNHMSHGWAEDTKEIEVLAGHLVLDLISTCEMTTKASYKMNIYISLLKELRNFDGSDFKMFNKYLTSIYYALAGYNCDDFYNLSSVIEGLNNLYFKSDLQDSVIKNTPLNQIEFNEICRNLSQILKIAKKNKNERYVEVTDKILKALRNSFIDKKNSELKQLSELKKILQKK